MLENENMELENECLGNLIKALGLLLKKNANTRKQLYDELMKTYISKLNNIGAIKTEELVIILKVVLIVIVNMKEEVGEQQLLGFLNTSLETCTFQDF